MRRSIPVQPLGGAMCVYVLVREDQNEHGYIDWSITGVFQEERSAEAQEALERLKARAEGLLVEGDSEDLDWQVSWKIEAQSVIQ